MVAAKTTAADRLASLLKMGGTNPEVKAFRQQCRDVYRLGGVLGLDAWIEARRNFGLIAGKEVNAAADTLQSTIGRILDLQTIQKLSRSPRRSWEDQQRLINEREAQQRQNGWPRRGTGLQINNVMVQRRRLPKQLLSSGVISVAERIPLQLPVVGALLASLLTRADGQTFAMPRYRPNPDEDPEKTGGEGWLVNSDQQKVVQFLPDASTAHGKWVILRTFH